MTSEAQKRAAAKWETEKTTQIKFKFHNEHDADILQKLKEVGNKQGYVKRLIREDKWIPCSERLPDETGHYLITARWQGELIVASDDFFSHGWDDFGDSVIAWRELPKPYKGGK